MYVHLLLAPDGSWEEAPPTFDVDRLSPLLQTGTAEPNGLPIEMLRSAAQQALDAVAARLRATTDGVLSIRHTLVGVAIIR